MRQGSNQSNNIEKKCEIEIYNFLNSLCKESFYGEVTFYFQDGVIEHCKQIKRIPKKQIINSSQNSLGGNNELP